MKSSVSCVAFSLLFVASSAFPVLAAPLTGTGTLPYPGATGDPPRNIAQAAGAAAGPYTGTWPGAGPNSPVDPAWIGTYSATGPMPQTPPVGSPITGTATLNFTIGGGYAPGALPVGTYFQFGDLDNGSASVEKYELQAQDIFGNVITTPWLDTPFAATNTAVPSDMPNYSFSAGLYVFDGTLVPGNPAISVFLKNNVPLGRLRVNRTATTTAFVLGAPLTQVPEPTSLALVLCGIFGHAFCVRRR